MTLLTVTVMGVVLTSVVPYDTDQECEMAWKKVSTALSVFTGKQVTHLCIIKEADCGKGTRIKCKGRAW